MTLKTIIAITAGQAIGGAITAYYAHWKAKRSSIPMIRNRKGVYVDAAGVWETRALIAGVIAAVGIVICGVAILSAA